jgi:phosphoribosylformimino-5-aminoimidazole carboxamide ribonucleotide (ProFAR) isomerase
LIVIPAIDVSGGRLVRPGAGALMPIHMFGGDPTAAARSFIEAGAGWLHFVDVDLAMEGEIRNEEALREICSLGVAIEASGGPVSRGEIDALLAVGASRVVLGSAALDDLPTALATVSGYGQQLAVGLECDGDLVRPRGRGIGGGRMQELVPALESAGASRFVHTNVVRSGTLAGADMESLRALLSIAEIPVVAAGGIATLEGLRALTMLSPAPEAVIIGRALYEGEIDLAAAIRVVGEAERRSS